MTGAAMSTRLLPDLAKSFGRFPVPATLSFGLCLYVNLFGFSGDMSARVAAGAAAGFLASGAAHLFAEGSRVARPTGLALAVAAALVAGVVGYFTALFETHHLLLFAGLIPLLMVAPFLRQGASQGALWFYNLRLWLAALLAAIVALTFALGLSAIAGALDYLFGIRGFDVYENIWGTALSLVAPIYGLSLMPKDHEEAIDIDSQKGTMLERAVLVVVNFVLVPVIFVYALILHAYAVKILFEQELPKGSVATMVSVFALAGTAAWMIAWPWRERSHTLLSLFMRRWFWLTIIPAVLLVVAIWRRIADYGVTPDRYGIVIVTVWIAALTFYLAWRRSMADMRAILGGMALLLLLGASGPFGANSLTIASQFARLEELLTVNGLLKDGKAVSPSNKPSAEVAASATSMIHVLQTAGGLDRLKPWFDGTDNDPFAAGNSSWALSSDIATFLGLSNPYNSDTIVSFSANLPTPKTFSGTVRTIGPFTSFQKAGGDQVQGAMTAMLDKENLTIKLESATYVIAARDLFEKVKAGTTASGGQGSIAIDIAPDATILLDQFFGDSSNPWPVSSARFWLVIRSGV